MTGKPVPVAPRPAASILLLRDGPAGLETFMVVRHHQIDFASGALVFPGGRMEAADTEMAAASVAAPPPGQSPGVGGRGPKPVEGRASFRTPYGPRLQADPLAAFKVAAIREAFEECGVLLARADGEDGFVPAARAAALDRAAPFADLMARQRLAPALDALVPFAHWITPDFVPKRFDTHFFLALAPADRRLSTTGARRSIRSGSRRSRRWSSMGAASSSCSRPTATCGSLRPMRTPPPRSPPLGRRRS